MTEFIAELTERNRREGFTYRKVMDDNAHLGVAALEDKTVQQAVVTILNQIYEEDFLGFSMDSPGAQPASKRWMRCRTRS